MAAEYMQVVTTVEKKEDAEVLAGKILAMRLAACVQIVGPITSRYWWREKIETSTEYQCVMKTRRNLYNEIEQAITAMHPYEVPEILAVALLEGNDAYLFWLDAELKKTE